MKPVWVSLDNAESVHGTETKDVQEKTVKCDQKEFPVPRGSYVDLSFTYIHISAHMESLGKRIFLKN